MNSTAPAPARPRRRARRWVVLLLLVAASLVGLDRFAAMTGEEQIAKSVRDGLLDNGVSARGPQVTVRGFPFLWQALRGHYRRVDIDLLDVRGEAGGTAVALPRLDLSVEGIDATVAAVLAGDRITARRVAGTTTLDYATVAALAGRDGLELSHADGRLRAKAPVRLLGREFTLVGLGRVEPAEGVVRVRFEELEVEGAGASDAIRRLAREQAGGLAIDVPLPTLPFPLTVERADARPEGLVVTGSAVNVPLR